jgi:hypothetical protein
MQGIVVYLQSLTLIATANVAASPNVSGTAECSGATKIVAAPLNVAAPLVGAIIVVYVQWLLQMAMAGRVCLFR